MVSGFLKSGSHFIDKFQAPKNLPAAAKQQKILDYFRESMSVFTLKELEKLLPAVGSINAMQVKDDLQGLQDENQIRVEKIGSGNWYWSFKSDAKKVKENTIDTLKAEKSRLIVSLSETERQIEEETAKREGKRDARRRWNGKDSSRLTIHC